MQCFTIKGSWQLYGIYVFPKLQVFCYSFRSLETTLTWSSARVLLEQYAAVQQDQQQAYECCSSEVLPECFEVLVCSLTVWPSRARAIEGSWSRVIFFGPIGLETYLCSRFARAVRSSKTTNSNDRLTSAARVECCCTSASEHCCCSNAADVSCAHDFFATSCTGSSRAGRARALE